MTWWTWWRLLKALRQRGRGRRESGAFLLAPVGNPRRVTDFVLYDDLDRHCLESGIIRFDGRQYGRLWALCSERSMDVVADVHTHPGAEFQSDTDRNNPMIAQQGHLALIIPRFASLPLRRADVGIYRYRGNHRWTEVGREQRKSFLSLRLW